MTNQLLPRLFVPRNDGQRTVYSDTQLKCKVTRFAFSEVPAEVAFTPATAFDSTVDPSALYFANARNVISRNPLTATFIDAITEGSNVAFVPNETFIYNNSTSRRPTSVNIGLTATGKVSPLLMNPSVSCWQSNRLLITRLTERLRKMPMTKEGLQLQNTTPKLCLWINLHRTSQ